MKKLLFIVCLLAACNTQPDYPMAQNALDAAHEFVLSTLRGDFKKANAYMLPDEDNTKRLQSFEENYRKSDAMSKREYAAASLEIVESDAVNDSTNIINYRNSYDKVGHKVKAIRKGNQWLIDFKYTFDGNL